eukprot:g7556.t1
MSAPPPTHSSGSSGSSTKKKVDNRVRGLLEHCVANNERSFFVILGDRGREQIVNLYFMLSKLSTRKQSQQILWCYKKELGFSSHKKSRARELKKKIARGEYDANVEDPFELFTSATDIRYCYYKDTEQVLGKTHQMLVLQDFEALTPNILCRTVETVAGGGMVVLLLKSMSSLRQLYNTTMDIHGKFSKEEGFEPRWNERFLLSLIKADTCLVLDDEMNLLPIAKNKAFAGEFGTAAALTNAADATQSPASSKKTVHGSLEITEITSARQAELSQLKLDLKDAEPLGSLLNLAKTLDQAQALMQFVDVISEKTLTQTVSLTAGRGRGKSASLGLALAAAIAYGYSNIFVSAPSPENLGTVFEFLLQGFDAIGYKEHEHYDVLVALNTSGAEQNLVKKGQENADGHNTKQGASRRGNIVRINVFKNHRQTVQYLLPEQVSSGALNQAEMLIVDEAAAIPLPVIKQMLGPYLTLLSSTVNGYEGTGRSLSLKLLADLKKEKKLSAEILLKEPIRYCEGDSVEAWLNDLCCLDASESLELDKGSRKKTLTCPLPSQCELFMVDRTALFSYHSASEKFLKKLMGLFVTSHYKNSPNDLILLSDAPGHHLFVLLAPTEENGEGEDSASDDDELPEILVAMHVASEGALNKEHVAQSLARGVRPAGDLISWTVSQQFADANFGSLNGARIVRIATHPEMMRQGYGHEAVRQFIEWVELKMVPAGGYAVDAACTSTARQKAGADGGDQPTGQKVALTVRDDIPALLSSVQDTKPCFSLDWLGTSFGVTLSLYQFWSRQNFLPVYLRQTANDVTGEHSGILVRKMSQGQGGSSQSWLTEFHADFRSRFLRLAKTQTWQKLPVSLALSIVGQPTAVGAGSRATSKAPSSANTAPGVDSDRIRSLLSQLLAQISRHDIHRIELFANKRAEVALIADLIPVVSSLYFEGAFLPSGTTSSASGATPSPSSTLQLSAAQMAILLAAGSQLKTFEQIAKELNLPLSQTHALFSKTMIKLWSDGIEPALANEVKAESGGALSTVNKSALSCSTSGGSGATAEGAAKVVIEEAAAGGKDASLRKAGEETLLQFGQKVSVKKRVAEDRADVFFEKGMKKKKGARR